jgi:NADPH2:quinone reductase
MRAVVVEKFGSYEDAMVSDIPKPTPRAGEVLVEVRAAPVNFVDLVVIAGKYQFAPPLPFTPGKGPSGVVVSVGEGVSRVVPGDRVLAMAETGGYAQYVVAPQNDCHRLPDDMAFSQAAAMSLSYDTAWFALRDRGRLAPGETALVLGATGAVGRACIQLAHAMGARTLAAVSSPARFDAARQAGADGLIDLSTSDLHESLRQQVFDQTNGAGADIVVDMIGGDAFDAAIRAVAWRGRLIVVGFASNRIPSLKVNYLMLKNIEVSGLQVSDYRKRRPDQMVECYREIFGFFEQGKIEPGPLVELPLARFREGLRMIKERSTSKRVILQPD